MSRCKGHCGGCNTRPWPPSQNLQGENAERRLDRQRNSWSVSRTPWTLHGKNMCALRYTSSAIDGGFRFLSILSRLVYRNVGVYRAGWVTLVPGGAKAYTSNFTPREVTAQ